LKKISVLALALADFFFVLFWVKLPRPMGQVSLSQYFKSIKKFVKEERKMTKMSYVTEEGLNKLREELKQLETVERPKIKKQIAEARDKGDLSENAEYDAAKEAQGMLEMRIQRLKSTIANARVLDESKIDTNTVQIMNTVKIKNKKNNAVMEYTIVSESEADLKQKKISVSSPIAKGLLGKEVGDVVDIEVPNGIIPFEIMEIKI
jgi:transcription elongation factor GreA